METILYKKTKQQLIDFEKRICEIFDTGELPFLMHLSGGNEDELISIFESIDDGDYVFSTHRSHYHYLLKGGSEENLEMLIREGRSMFVFDKKIKFFTSSVLAGTCGIAAGVALSLNIQQSKNRVWCFIGDGAEDEGHFYEAVRFVESMDLPCTFIIEDNDRSVVSNKNDRGSGYVLNWPKCVMRYTYTSFFPHGGTGTKNFVVFKEDIVGKHRGKQ